MPNVTNIGKYGKSGTLVIDSDTHFGVSSCVLVGTTNDEQFEGIAGDVQAVVGTPMWRLQVEFNQDHATSGSLSLKSIEDAGKTISVEFTPNEDEASFAIDAIMKPANVGGGTGRRTATLDLPCVGQPTRTPAA